MKKILLIEDDHLLQKVLTLKLSSKYEVVTAENGREGMEKALSENPDLILLDLIMPEVSGFEFLVMVKANDKTKEIPIIIQSALPSKEDIQKAMDLGANNYLIKGNISLEKIMGLVGNYLN
ncbi:response regulator [Candidatus Gracilibacteria bacterium]|nr:response regulator [Candidatus Gracilibacteria bacterium]